MKRVLVLSGLCLAAVASAGPLTGHPLITPYKGSTLGDQEARDFDQLTVPVGVKNGKPVLLTVEGKRTSLRYTTPKDRSELEIAKNYEDAFKAGGFELLYRCQGYECPQVCQITGIGCAHNAQFMVARLPRPAQGDVVAALKTTPFETWITIVEAKPMETGLVKIDASALEKGIDADGHVAVYGIVFDTGKADLKPESDAQLVEIAKLLKERPELNIHVVGHTDNVGKLAQNQSLSERRAKSVVEALAKKHGIAKGRLNPAGVGPLVPLTTNDTDAGRARNRRVDLVKQ